VAWSKLLRTEMLPFWGQFFWSVFRNDLLMSASGVGYKRASIDAHLARPIVWAPAAADWNLAASQCQEKHFSTASYYVTSLLMWKGCDRHAKWVDYGIYQKLVPERTIISWALKPTLAKFWISAGKSKSGVGRNAAAAAKAEVVLSRLPRATGQPGPLACTTPHTALTELFRTVALLHTC